MSKFTCKDGIAYQYDAFGVLHQVDPQPYKYDPSYVSTYDTEAYRQGSEILQALRLGFIAGAYGALPKSILDIGYGNGAFMKFAKKAGVQQVAGFDVTDLPIEGCTIFPTKTHKEVQVWTFHDSLEHMNDLTFINEFLCSCEMIVISLPWCLPLNAPTWFDEWKHRKPHEHLHHFTDYTLSKFMASNGWRMVSKSNHEDYVRTPPDGQLVNILSMAFKRV